MNLFSKTKSIVKSLAAVGLMISISACQLTPVKETIRIPTYGDYYLWLKSLDNNQLLQEIAQQNINKKTQSPDADIYLILLHSLPKSPIYNPYTAKSLLNELQLQYIESRYNPTNLALITLLRDLLNEQLLMIQKYDNINVDFRNSQKLLIDQKETSVQQEQKLKQSGKTVKELEQQVKLLKEQINQLHRIEENISEHGN
ncbi:hypothetical protein ACPUVO_18790 [Pseudocolwellia sp. HL-MZ19]|uniref:hypothetical protein n=1 Tax=unclassified Pseudocolwellia TaxID=2848178 RepID=UPI003CEB34ED